MATQKEIDLIFEEMKKVAPSEHFKSISKSSAGIQAILGILNEKGDCLTAGKISEYMKVSTARVAVLLKKMVAKDLVKKSNSPSDARVVVVKLTPHGKDVAAQIKKEMNEDIANMIDTVGMDRLLEFTEIFNEINSITKKKTIEL